MILTATRTKDVINVDLYGGPENACGTVKFTMPSVEEAQVAVVKFTKWMTDGSPVTLNESETEVTLTKE